MVHKLFNYLQVSAPGSLMLLGEHAILNGTHALVCAIAKRITVKLIPNSNTQCIITIQDSKLGMYTAKLNELTIAKPYQFVISAILTFKQYIKVGFALEISSEVDNAIGCGSSAAVTVATIAVLAEWLYEKPVSKLHIFHQAKQAMLNVQQVGSGADLIASIYGGVLCYKMSPITIEELPIIPDLSVVYCGYKRPTPEVIALVNVAQQQQPQIYESIYKCIEICVQQAIMAIKQHKWAMLGKLFKHHHGLLAAIGVSNEHLDALVYQLTKQREILGAKISGAGLGDCIIGLGSLAKKIFPQNSLQANQGILQFAVSIAEQGLIYEY